MSRLETDLKIRDQDRVSQHKFETETKSTKIGLKLLIIISS